MATNGINGSSRTPPLGTPARASSQRLRAASLRACEAHQRAAKLAGLVNEELDETTIPHGVPVTELHDEDSLVIVVKEALAANSK